MNIPAARLLFCLAAAGSVAGCAGSSGPSISTVDKSFLGGIGSYDRNHDGFVTCDEWRAVSADLFTRANKSGSGFLSEDEFRNLGTTDRTFQVATFKYFDANGDGKVDKKEFVERPNPAFTYADKDKDCRLNENEQITARNLSAPPRESTPARTAITSGPSTGGGGY